LRHWRLAREIGSQLSSRIEGTCIKHRFGKCSIKMYDKCGIVLRRIETTANDVSFFKHHRKVEHRSGPPTRGLVPVKKTIYSLIDLRANLLGGNGAISLTCPRWTTSQPGCVPSAA
jgi:hypothetical protein